MSQKQVATPSDKKLEKMGVNAQAELYRLEEKPNNDANKSRKNVLKRKLNTVLDKIVGDTKQGGGRQRILDVIKQQALNLNRKDRGEPARKTVAAPKPLPDKSLTELYKERLDKGRGREKTPSVGEAIVAGASAIKRKVMGDDKYKNSKGGAILKKNVEKMMYGGMSGGKKHMYVAGGNVTDNPGLKALRASGPKGMEAYNNITKNTRTT